MHSASPRRRKMQEVARESQTRLFWDDVPVDLFFAFSNYHDECYQRVQFLPFAGVTIPFLAAEDLVIFKVLFNRGKDWEDVRHILLHLGDRFDAALVLRWLEDFLGQDDDAVQRFRELAGA